MKKRDARNSTVRRWGLAAASSLLVIAFALPAFAQARGGKGGKGMMGADRDPETAARRIVERMTDRLDLTEEQQAEILPIVQEQVEQRRARWEETRERVRRQRDRMCADRGEHWEALRSSLSGILTDDQLETWERLHEERQERMRRGRHCSGDRRGGGRRGSHRGGGRGSCRW